MQKRAGTIARKETERAMKRDRTLHAMCALGVGLAVAVVLSLDLSGRAHSQSGANGNIGGIMAQGGVGLGLGHSRNDPLASDDGSLDPMMAERRMRALNAERQRQMVSDTDKLLKLAKELNSEVATTSSDSFTPDQLHKIAEIEKLARSVRERMTAGTGEAPNMLPPPTMIYPGRQGGP
jgi:hypothetical protein